ncbi:hypothetical protein [Sharpea azabuensis]|uniref:hypothetical protein n=1 Tax=Sharpea azabuensis TaxID=322505 RepID=UPI001568E13D|nr:hypothetical protein [Sharpea azabuensis]
MDGPFTYSLDIEDCDKVVATDYDDFISGSEFKGFDKQSFVKDITFYNSVIPFILANSNSDWQLNKMNWGENFNLYNSSLVATCDPSLIIKVKEDQLYTTNISKSIFTYYYQSQILNRGDYITGSGGQHEYSILCNIRKKNLIPYGGFDLYTRNSCVYV